MELKLLMSTHSRRCSMRFFTMALENGADLVGPVGDDHNVKYFDSVDEIVAEAEAFCESLFKETREEFGLDCCADFASDYNQTLEEYVAEQGNPAFDDGWFLNLMGNHGFVNGIEELDGNLLICNILNYR